MHELNLMERQQEVTDSETTEQNESTATTTSAPVEVQSDSNASHNNAQSYAAYAASVEQSTLNLAHGFDPDTCKSLYVGNLAPQVTEPLLYEIFGAVGHVESVKIIKDRVMVQGGSSVGYGFVDYSLHDHAVKALNQLNSCKIYGMEIRVNWAFAGGHREDTSNHHHIFVGDLSPEIDDKALNEAFAAFGSLSDARVMWDQATGRSRGYGFIAFRQKERLMRYGGVGGGGGGGGVGSSRQGYKSCYIVI
eukprot:TRINITY_DN988_c0_g2_i2.p1 TRINITY_DN988_c0_g2~~TRINITY_DN988_c0_g2_i2.p1  ORF type:complete len:249 (+),score=32.61 TRINITY_DN988_c0_g2_i2:18-764(+)